MNLAGPLAFTLSGFPFKRTSQAASGCVVELLEEGTLPKAKTKTLTGSTALGG